MNNRKLIILLLITLSGAVILSYFYSPGVRGYRVENVVFPNSSGDRVNSTLFIPSGSGKKAPFPAVITVHYGLQNREALQPKASTLADQGIITMVLVLKLKRNVDGRAKNISDYMSDISGAFDYLISRSDVDADKVFLSGHSIGANLSSMTAAGEKRAAGEIAVGYPIEFPPDAPRHLLMTAGVYDELHQPAKMLAAYDETLPEGSERVEFFKVSDVGTIKPEKKPLRIYFHSFLSDHYLEPTDPDIAAATTVFIKKVSGVAGVEKPSPIPFRMRMIGRILFFYGLMFLWVYVLLLINNKGEKMRLPELLKDRAGSILFIILCGVMSFAAKPTESLIPQIILSSLFAALIAGNFFIFLMKKRKKLPGSNPGGLLEEFEKGGAKTAVCVGIFIAAFIIGLWFHAGAAAWSSPVRIFRNVIGIFYLALGWLYVFTARITGLFLNPDWTLNLFSIPVIGLFLVETVKPGLTGFIVNNFFSLIIGTLQKLDFKLKWKINPASAALLAVVIIICIFVWKHILAEGYMIGTKEIMGLGYLFFCFILLPAVTATALFRWDKIRSLLDRFSLKETEEV